MKPKETYDCHYAAKPIEVNGLLDDLQWQRAGLVDFKIPVSLNKPLSKTEGRLLWDEHYIYAAFKAYDKDIFSYLTDRDSPTCNEDVLEIFLKTDPDKEPYFNFEINAQNTVYDAFNVKRNAGGPDHHRWSHWNCAGLESAVTIKGTLNEHEDVDECWQLVVAVPYNDLPTLAGREPKVGDEWLFHLARYDYSVHLDDGVELSSCAPCSKVAFHRYEDWITLRFVL